MAGSTNADGIPPGDGEQQRVEIDLTAMKGTWGNRLLIGAPLVGMAAYVMSSPGLMLTAFGLLFFGAWLILTWRHETAAIALYEIANRLIILEKLAGVEHRLDSDGLPSMRFRGEEMSLIELEDLAARMRSTPLDLGRDDDEVSDACDA